MEPAERQEKIPTESQKRERTGRRERKIARGMKAYCSLVRNYCKGRGEEGGTTRRKKTREGQE